MRLIFFLLTLGATTAFAQGTPSAPAKKTSISTQIYEKEKNEKSFSSTVKMVREVQGAWEVLFDKHPGVYTIGDKSDSQSLLVEAQKTKTPVMVRVDEENSRILSVQWGAPGKHP